MQKPKNKSTKVKPRSITVQRSPPQETSFSQDIGSLVGKGVTSLSKWLGFGAYTIDKNTVIGAGGTVPSMHSTNDSIIVRHREYVGDVNSTTTYASTSLPLNPGLVGTYPWLGRIAQSFQQYRILGMVVEYIPEVSEVSANEISLGVVALTAQYRTDLPAYPSLLVALESEFAVSGKPNCPLNLAIECSPKQSAYNSWFVRTGGVPSGEDTKLYDFVDLVVIANNQQTSNVVLGQIWLSYEIELMRPTSFLDPPAQQFSVHIFSSVPTSASPLASGAITGYVNPNGSTLIGGTATQQAANDGFSFATGSNSCGVVLPRGLTGIFFAQFNCVGGSTASVVGDTAVSLLNCTANPYFNSTSSIISTPIVAETTTALSTNFCFSISDAQAAAGQAHVVLFTGGTLTLPVSGGQI